MKLNEVRYAFREDAKCHHCGNEFSFRDTTEHSFFKDNVNCPTCGAENILDHALRRKKESDAK